ncbi:MAG: hypothetical protein NXY57DRAFT_991107 [Lentinula lateritia]|nr:MAG: hypothetical protein NXY57DRAFT_991107 [Lentinula lateritia]
MWIKPAKFSILGPLITWTLCMSSRSTLSEHRLREYRHLTKLDCDSWSISISDIGIILESSLQPFLISELYSFPWLFTITTHPPSFTQYTDIIFSCIRGVKHVPKRYQRSLFPTSSRGEVFHPKCPKLEFLGMFRQAS